MDCIKALEDYNWLDGVAFSAEILVGLNAH